MYKLTDTGSIIRTSDGAHIPAAPGNLDYEGYLAWVGAGNTPALDVPPAKTYRELRAERYATIPLQDQLDMQYWDLVNGTTTWRDWIAGIKSALPKI